MNLRRAIEERLVRALDQAGAPPNTPALVAPSGRVEFGDYQVNGVMAAAKLLKTNPRELARKVVELVDLSDMAEKVEVAGPGFINIHLKGDWCSERLTERMGDERLGVEPPDDPQTIVVDYSHPNLAKEMHAGHLRSTVIGDAICRTLEFLGHTVIRQNHVGDWGTQFGMLLGYLDRLESRSPESAREGLADLEEFYRLAKQLFDTDPDFADTARQYVVKLQSGDPDCCGKWDRFIDESLRHCQHVYDRLGISLKPSDVRGESAYNDDLPKVVEDLKSADLLTESEGAQCVFLNEFRNRDNEPLPVIVRKSDGGYLYATTDLGAIRYRVDQLHADRILYIVDARQTLHLRQVFAVAREASFAPDAVSLEHHPFGLMLGADNRPFRTREGGTVKLMDLLDEAERRAFDLVTEKNPDLSESRRRQITSVVGIGAVKYADLSQNRTSDYVFSFDKMLSLDGNTAPYMQYAYARIRSIFRKGGLSEVGDGEISLGEPAERALGIKLFQFPETIDTLAQDALPNVLCAYLFELGGLFMGFYESCPVLQSDEPLRTSRLMLCDLTARTIRTGLNLLGIETLDQM